MFGNSDLGECKPVASTQLQKQSLTEQLLSQKKSLESRLEEVNGVISAMEENPQTANLLDRLVTLGIR